MIGKNEKLALNMFFSEAIGGKNPKISTLVLAILFDVENRTFTFKEVLEKISNLVKVTYT